MQQHTGVIKKVAKEKKVEVAIGQVGSGLDWTNQVGSVF
jgi:hypothetical protein